MAEKRMFTKKIVDSDAFLEMPLSAQCLYFHLNMRADDDGFVNNPKRIVRYINASEDDIRILLMKRFIIGFESGVIVIKHWRMHNTLRKDRYNPTDYQEEFSRLIEKGNNAYTERITNKIELTGEETPSEPEEPEDDDPPKEPTKTTEKKNKYGEYKKVRLTPTEYSKLEAELGHPLIDNVIMFLDEYITEKGYTSKSHYLAIKRWVIDAVKKKNYNKAQAQSPVAQKPQTWQELASRWESQH